MLVHLGNIRFQDMPYENAMSGSRQCFHPSGLMVFYSCVHSLRIRSALAENLPNLQQASGFMKQGFYPRHLQNHLIDDALLFSNAPSAYLPLLKLTHVVKQLPAVGFWQATGNRTPHDHLKIPVVGSQFLL